MKRVFLILFIFLLFTNLFSNILVSCPNDIQNPTYAYNSLIDGEYPDTPYYFIDDSSVACGGDELTLDIYVSPVDNGYSAVDNGIVDINDKDLIVIKKDGKYYNNKIFVNNIPCMPKGTVGFKSYVDSDGTLLDSPYYYIMEEDYTLDKDESQTIMKMMLKHINILRIYLNHEQH